ncbi:MAG: DNA-directed RNA polymerase subunit beta' [Candidatus Pacebacteria bacterium]|nr:DNA-directed RNA polymerase subunit beta' [Candidatus Paceibacterota bacterium]
MRVADIQSIQIQLTSPEEILSWSSGEVLKPETINYRTQKSEKDGLFCQKIFGPEKDYECYCGKYKRIRYKGVVCDKCGVEVTKSLVRRERMGHIKLACPIAHIWFLRGVPSQMGMVIGLPMQQLEKIIYFAAYIIIKVNEDAKKIVLDKIKQEYKIKLKIFSSDDSSKADKKKKEKIEELKKVRDRAWNQVSDIKELRVLSEIEYSTLSLKYGEVFEAETGAEVLREYFSKINLKKEIEKIKKILENTSSLKRKKLLDRLKLLEKMDKAGIRPEWMFMTVFPVLPPDLRPMVQLDGGRYASSDLNDLYRRVINRNNRLKRLLEINAPEVIVRNEKRMLQEAVDALIDNGMRKGQTTKASTGGHRLLKSLADMLKGKQGRFRQNLLGKRVDYSGRSVIVVGPDLKLSQCGLPKKMALELFKPFVIKKILDKELFYNVKGATRFIELEHDEVWAILEEIVKDKLVLLNRAPTLHRLGIQAFQPVLVEGEAIQLHPMACKAFNADFDGDTMAVHLPLSDQAQKEAKEIMFSPLNLLNPVTGTPITVPTQDIVFGCYFLTMLREGVKGEGKIFGSPQEAILAYEFGAVDFRAKIKVRIPQPTKKEAKNKNSQSVIRNSQIEVIETSVGRIIFNNVLPVDLSFQNYEMCDKNLNNVVSQVVEIYSWEIAGKILDKIKNLGFEYSTKSGVSWGMNDLIIPKDKKKIVQLAEKQTIKIQEYYQKGKLNFKERKTNIIEIWKKTKSSIEKLIPETLLPFSSPVLLIESGARGSWTQLLQMTGMKGLVINPSGEIIELPIKSSLKEGFDVLEYFISTHGARKGTADTALRTSTAGYLTRRLVDVSHDVITIEDECSDKEGIIVSLKEGESFGQKSVFKILGRTILEDINNPSKKGEIIIKKNEIIDWDKAKKIINLKIDKVRVRSPLSCKTIKGVCQKCYGWDLGSNKLVKLGTTVGVVAAQAIGEPGTQLTMRTFHAGGVASASDITKGLPRVEEIFETRIPSAKAVISHIKGKMIDIVREKDTITFVLSTDKQDKKKKSKATKEVIKYEVPSAIAFEFKIGETIEKGQQLCEGSLDLKELFKVAGVEAVQKYIIHEIQKIYVSQGVNIHDKHIEVIVRQMFSRVKIKEIGDSYFSQGEVVEKSCFLEENNILKKAKKKLASCEPIILGISKVALSTDSFLSAASFQETSRVLIKAALEGKQDKLTGLKENVIIGKLVPVGTEFKK